MYIRKNPDGTLDIMSDHYGVVVQRDVPLVERGQDEGVEEGSGQTKAEAEDPRTDE
jgi:hypothetical protein